MNTHLDEACELDVDLVLVLAERGHVHHHEVGERIAAAQSRLTSAEQLADAVREALASLRAGGWDGKTGPVGFTLDASHDDGADGREFALRSAISDGRILVGASNPDPDAARTAFTLPVPEGSVRFSARKDDGLIVDFRYLSQGHGARADDDMERAFRDAGVKFYGAMSQQNTR